MTSPTRQRWAKAIKAGRKKRGMSRTQIAHQLGVSHATIRSIETGCRAPGPELLEKLVTYLHIPPFDLFYDEG